MNKKKSFNIKLIFVLVSIILVLGYLGFFFFSSPDLTNVQDNLYITSENKANFLIEFLESKQEKVRISTTKNSFIDYMKNPQISALDSIRGELRNIAGDTFLEMFLADSNGKILASTYEERIGEDISISEQYTELHEKLGISYLELMKKEDVLLPEYDSVLGEDVLIISEPVKDKISLDLIGILGVRLRLEDIQELFEEETSSWNTKETYVIDENGILLTPSIFLKGENKGVLTQFIDTENSEECLEDLEEKGEGAFEREKEEKEEEGGDLRVFENYNGEKTIGTDFPIPQLEWCILSEVGYSEVAGEKSIINAVLIVLGILIVVNGIGFFVSKSFGGKK